MSLSDAASIVGLVKDVILVIAGTVTAVVAVQGVNKWRHEMSGKADFDAARGLARATFKLRNAIHACRSPLIRAGEYPDGYDFSDTTNTPRDKAAATAHAYNGRWTPVVTAIEEFETQSLEAEALWGGQIRPLTAELRQCANVIWVAMETIVDDAAVGGAHFAQDKEFGRRTRAQASGSADDEQNELSQRIKAATGALEAKLREKLSRR